ncbi:patatin-like phospholipase family protein [Nonomuraea lactucae]|uniref:patatin-like phospholipase family protein n=1 Tax=Nonomuraea lactucae TaxID=2249762 RepID=UPI000DE1D441|nr:patatin-like phospholipase family protein [Nonomuraea lactucae]
MTADGVRRADLVLEGGGVKSVALLGAILELDEAGYVFPRIAGTSGGAIVGALVAAFQRAGRDPHELLRVMEGLDYDGLLERSKLQRLTGRLGDLVQIALHAGAYSGERIVQWLADELAKVGVSTFEDLALDDPESSLAVFQRYSVVAHVTDLSRQTLVRLPWDYRRYGRNADQQSVAAAVWASSALPIVFRPVRMATASGSVTWVDGGVVAGFPITVFDRTDGASPRWPTWGVKLSAEPLVTDDRPITTAIGIQLARLQTLSRDWTRYSLEDGGVNRRTIYVDTSAIEVHGFDIDHAARQALVAAGRVAAKRFLELQGAGS